MRARPKSIKKDWKSEAVQRQLKLQRYKAELKRQKQRAEKWRARYYAQKKAHRPTKVKYHSYHLELMWMAVLMQIDYNISLRGVSQSICKLGSLYGLKLDYISPSTIRNWCLKFGIYCLKQPIAAGKYALICDESIEIGRERLLLLLVVPLDNISYQSPLKIEQVKVLHVAVQHSWKSVELAQIIEQRSKEKGIEIVYGICDKCYMLRKGLKLCMIPWVEDCTHVIAKLAKHLYKRDDSFNNFIKKMNQLRAQWVLSKYNYYLPPRLRSKSRFHQVFIVYQWAERILSSWEELDATAQKKLSFVLASKELIRTLRQLNELINSFCKVFKYQGISQESIVSWQENWQENWQKNLSSHCQLDAPDLSSNGLAKKTLIMISELEAYVQLQLQQLKQQLKLQESEQSPYMTQLLCCSDVIESMFGKYKNKGGPKIITDDVLKVAAYPVHKTMTIIKQAMEEEKMATLIKWKQEYTPISKLALLKREKAKRKSKEKSKK